MVDAICKDSEGWGPLSSLRDFDFTTCFEDVILIPLPSLVFVFAGAFRLLYLARSMQSNTNRRAKDWLYWLRMIFTIANLGVAIGSLVYESEFVGPRLLPIVIAGLVMAVPLVHLEYVATNRTGSSLLSTYWFLLIVTYAFKLRTWVLMDRDITQVPFNATLFSLTVVLLLLDQFRTDHINWDKTSDGPAMGAGPISILTVNWVSVLINKAYKSDLDFPDLWDLPKHMTTNASYTRFEKQWIKELKKKKPSLNAAVFRAFALEYSVPTVLVFIQATLQLLQPKLLSALLAFIASYTKDSNGQYIGKPQPVEDGIFMSCGFFVISALSTLCGLWYFNLSVNWGLKIRAGLTGAIYRKSFRLSPASRQNATTGEIQNRMAVDCVVFWQASVIIGQTLATFYQLALTFYFLYDEVGIAIFAGIGIIILMVPLNFWGGNYLRITQEAKMKFMDLRLRLMDEIVGGIKVVKLYAWEKPLLKRITDVRNNEINALQKRAQVAAAVGSVFQIAPYLISLVSFGVYSAIANADQPLDSTRIFVSLSYIQLLNSPMSILTQSINTLFQLQVAYRRIGDFLTLEELDDTTVTRLDQDDKLDAITITDGSFSWVKDAEPPTLTDINISIRRGTLTAVVGRIGEGKTSLLSAIVGDMYKKTGEIIIRGSMAYVAQQAFILSGTLRENILFGSPFDEERYKTVIEACSLLPDIAMLPAGDLSEIGERGINLSGGQKQRVSIARAVYADASIYLLDDPLSAVDAHVNKALFDKVFGRNGLLDGKTRILVTHSVNHLPNVDEVILIKDGQIKEKGSYVDLMDRKGEIFDMMGEYSKGNNKDFKDLNSEDKQSENEDGNASTLGSENVIDIKSKGVNDAIVHIKSDGVLVKKEHREKGNVVCILTFNVHCNGWGVYWMYIKSCSFTYMSIYFLSTIAANGISVGSRYWLNAWSASTSNGNLGYWIGIYALFCFAFAITQFGSGFVFMGFAAIVASRRMHEQMLGKLFRLRMEFFDTTPLGRVVNRFSTDVQYIDQQIPFMANSKSNIFLYLELINNDCCARTNFSDNHCDCCNNANLPGPSSSATWRGILRSTKISLELQGLKGSFSNRMESVSRSPIFQHFSESLGGISTIKAYSKVQSFINENVRKIDDNQKAFYHWMVANRWQANTNQMVQSRSQFLSAFVAFGASIFAVVSRDTLSAGLVGLALSYAITVQQNVLQIVQGYTNLETNIVAVERVKEYVELPTEAAEETDFSLPESWPAFGEIEFKNYMTRYREGLELVLKGISFKVQCGQKVGIVGRTGAGKSSLTLALFRLIEAAGREFEDAEDQDRINEKVNQDSRNDAQILIDGVDISKIGLRTLRSRLSIIPQDPTLFVGTIRDNLDPFSENDDAVLWAALESAHLKDHISSLEGQLNATVSQGGENFSVGQRQLICLARALLRKTKVLVLDEATAAVDFQTDSLIQQTIRREFKDRTILTIAHRKDFFNL
ncbi:multidrug resistance-associated protein 3 [Endogone sp. FLAS-F59071]|nr:multidrug resistance-associated protein 3 [Endogone sp. FLAS-F59071]|eukprot:RUS22445.1 multidrug resistance-associated protein 3 [Endogone sp. FLAS-F59071]